MAKGSEWKERAVIRKDFRHGKTEYRVGIDQIGRPPGTRKKKKKKQVVVQYRYTGDEDWKMSLFNRSGWITWGKYAKEEDAIKAIETQRQKPFWGTEFEFRIKGKKGNV